MQTAHVPARRVRLPLVDRAAVIHAGTAPYRLSAQLAVVAVLAALPTLLRPSLLSGPDVMIGSARGTALVLLVLTVPLLVLAATRPPAARRAVSCCGWPRWPTSPTRASCSASRPR